MQSNVSCPQMCLCPDKIPSSNPKRLWHSICLGTVQRWCMIHHSHTCTEAVHGFWHAAWCGQVTDSCAGQWGLFASECDRGTSGHLDIVTVGPSVIWHRITISRTRQHITSFERSTWWTHRHWMWTTWTHKTNLCNTYIYVTLMYVRVYCNSYLVMI